MFTCSAKDRPNFTGREVSITIPSDAGIDWLASIMESDDDPGNNQSPMPKIQKIPGKLGQIDSNKICYLPSVVSIGPYHHGKQELGAVDELKPKMARQFAIHCGNPISDMYNKVAEMTCAARNCYAEGSTDGYNDDDFAKMMFLDGCFILNFIECKVHGKRKLIKMKRDVLAYVQRDLFLLENQIPFLVLEALMSFMPFEQEDGGIKMLNTFVEQTRALPPPEHRSSFGNIFSRKHGQNSGSGHETRPNAGSKKEADKICTLANVNAGPEKEADKICIVANTNAVSEKEADKICTRTNVNARPENEADKICTMAKSAGKKAEPGNQEETHRPVHLLDILHTQIVGKQNKPGPYCQLTQSSDWYSYRSVNELKATGINFKASKTNCFTEVKYERGFIYGNLMLPPMTIDDSTKSILLNLVAYETCPDALDDSAVTSYICFMDSLIDHAEDVRELRSEGILLNFLGSDQQVADLFNEIGNDLVPNPLLYDSVKGQIEKHYKNTCKIWITEWLHAHFRSPWAFLAFLAAVFAIILSIIQTYLAANPPKN